MRLRIGRQPREPSGGGPRLRRGRGDGLPHAGIPRKGTRPLPRPHPRRPSRGEKLAAFGDPRGLTGRIRGSSPPPCCSPRVVLIRPLAAGVYVPARTPNCVASAVPTPVRTENPPPGVPGPPDLRLNLASSRPGPLFTLLASQPRPSTVFCPARSSLFLLCLLPFSSW